MSTTYTITVKNIAPAGGVAKPFMLFVEQPKFVGKEEPNVWSNVFMQSDDVTGPHGSVSFSFPKDFYAVTGSTRAALAGGGIVKTSDYQDIKLDGKSVVSLDDPAPAHRAPHISISNDPAAAGNISPGSFAYITEKHIDNSPTKYVFIGLGGMNESGDVVPIATFAPEANSQYIMTPKNAYYINSGRNEVGKIMDYAQTVRESALIDFTGKDEKEAVVTIDRDNKWVVTFI